HIVAVPVAGLEEFLCCRVEVVEAEITIKHHHCRCQVVQQAGIEGFELLLADHDAVFWLHCGVDTPTTGLPCLMQKLHQFGDSPALLDLCLPALVTGPPILHQFGAFGVSSRCGPLPGPGTRRKKSPLMGGLFLLTSAVGTSRFSSCSTARTRAGAWSC